MLSGMQLLWSAVDSEPARPSTATVDDGLSPTLMDCKLERRLRIYEMGKFRSPSGRRDDATFDALMNLDCAGPPSIPAGLWDYIDLTTMSLYFFIRDASSASSDHRTYALYLKKRPGKAAMYKPRESLLVYNGLQALSKIFERPAGIFDHPRTMGLVELLKGYLDSSGSYFSPFCLADFEKEEHCADIEPAQWAPYPTVTTAYKPLSSITTNWDEFLGAFFTLFSCHALLWSAGIRHQDIRPENLVWDLISRHARLCDFDLCHSPDLPEVGSGADGPMGTQGCSNSGTWTFMASELITDYAMACEIERVYRHEVEAFFTVLIWITFRYANGTLRDSAPLEDWKSTTCWNIALKREATFSGIENTTIPQPPTIRRRLWTIICLTIIRLRQFLNKASIAQLAQSFHELPLKNSDYHDYDYDEPDTLSFKLAVSLEKYNGLRSLRKIFTWPIFKHPRAKPFVALLKGYPGLVASGNT
ncbi:hypothetical protein NMY22_g4229 [Coprinellus aureogranulatus]|nr:hypothetical protein NMY22_g4229 [Coprinellus aureogranulatus]